MSKKRLVHRGVFFILLLLAFFQNRNSYPFEIGSLFTDPWHENIVYSAFANWTGSGISQECLDRIISGNRDADLNHNWIPPALHTNRELHWAVQDVNSVAWDQSAACIRNWMANAATQLMSGNYDETTKCLGMASHTIADFFSHSNWPENKGNSIDGLVFEIGFMPVDFTWYTIETTFPGKCLEKDNPDDEGGADAFHNAYYAAISMTQKEYRDFEMKLFNTYPSGAVYSALIGLGINPTLKIMQWPENRLVQKINSTQKISWDYIAIRQNTQVKISLLKNNSWIGDIAEVSLTDKQYTWQVGRYYLIYPGGKQWYSVDPLESAFYRIRIISLDNFSEPGSPDPGTPPVPSRAAPQATGEEFEIKTFYFTNPLQDASLKQNQNYNVTWQVSDFTGVDASLYLVQNGAQVGKIVDLNGYDLNNKVYLWSVGHYGSGAVAAPGTGYQLKIQFGSAPYLKFNTSGATFSIVPSTLPKISGYVRTSQGIGIGSVLMSGLPGQVYTNGSGDYSASVSLGWQGTVTPTKAGYVFNPVSRTYSNVTADQAGQNYTASACTYSISPTSRSFTKSGGVGSIQVTSPGGCGWTATSFDYWITINSGGSGSGSGTVRYTVAANSDGGERSGTIEIEGLAFTVTQAAGYIPMTAARRK